MLAGVARQLIHRRLAGALRPGTGSIRIVEAGRAPLVAGDGSDAVTVTVNDPQAYVAFVQGNVASGEAYVDGKWDVDDLVMLLRIVARNFTDYSARIDSGPRKALSKVFTVLSWFGRQSRGGAQANIASHYDLGNDMFGKFLCDERMYSCAVFPSPAASLTEAQRHKLDLLCRKAGAGTGKRFLDLGCGWGALAVWAAREHGCEVEALTLSSEQHAYVSDRVRREGLADRITVTLRDYRDFDPGPGFDCVVSVEMIEAVGPHNFGTYFQRVRDFLRPGGAAVIQAITKPVNRYRDALYDVDFIKKHIFPGGACPSQEVMAQMAGRAGLIPGQVEDITAHYVTTLAAWRANFSRRIDDIIALGYDRGFCRKMIYYFAYCEAGFAEGELEDVQAEYSLPA